MGNRASCADRKSQGFSVKVLRKEHKSSDSIYNIGIKRIGGSFSTSPDSVPPDVLFSNQFLEDLDKIWELRHWIPDPTKPLLPPNLTKVNY